MNYLSGNYYCHCYLCLIFGITCFQVIPFYLFPGSKMLIQQLTQRIGLLTENSMHLLTENNDAQRALLL